MNAQEPTTIVKVGHKAPSIEAQDQNGKDWKSSDYLGKKAILLYFYPKDNTPGCTKQACSLRDNIGAYKSANVEVVGVSMDTVESHKKFVAQHNLNFTLLADPTGKIADKFGVRMPGKNMARRVSFLIDKEGVVQHIVDNPDPQKHLDEMKTAIEKLKK